MYHCVTVVVDELSLQIYFSYFILKSNQMLLSDILWHLIYFVFNYALCTLAYKWKFAQKHMERENRHQIMRNNLVRGRDF